MYVRFHTVRRRRRQAYTYLEVIFSERRNGKVRQERVCSLGWVEELRDSGVIDWMIARLVQVAWQQWVWVEALELGTA